MKRVFSGLLAVLLLCTFCACAQQEPQREPMDTSVQTVIDLASALPVGTMGVSLKAIESAVKLMDWCQQTTVTDEEIREGLKAHEDSLDEFGRYTFQEQLYLLMSTASAWRDETRKETDLHQVGLNSKKYSWDETAFARMDVIAEVVEMP